MDFEHALAIMREKGKVKRPYMKDFYLLIAKVRELDTTERLKYVFEDRIVCSNGNGGASTRFSISNRDLLATDWIEHKPPIHVTMYPSEYSVRCPKCARLLKVGNDINTCLNRVKACRCGEVLIIDKPN